MTARMIPERTIDSMFVIEVVEFVSHALIWSPSNTAGQVDHWVNGLGGIAVPFEVKGVVTDAARDPNRPWKCPIDYAQLNRYITYGLPVVYVLPGRPDPFAAPWIRNCTLDPDSRGRCQACHNANQSSRRWAGSHRPAVQTAPLQMRAQPWFAHWCWIMSATALDAYLKTQGAPAGINVADANMITVPGAERLCHFLTDIANGTRAPASFGVDVAEIAGMLAEIPAREPEDDDDQTVMTVVSFPASTA